MTHRQKIEKYFHNMINDAELKKPLEQMTKESKTRTAAENSRYFEKLFNRYHEKRAQGGKQ